MEVNKLKTFRSKSLNSQRVSIRRKNSFNKIRLLFENNCKTSETNRHSDTLLKNKSSKELGIQSNYDSLKLIEEKDFNCNKEGDSRPLKQKQIYDSKNVNSFKINDFSIDEKWISNVSDSRLVKNTINYFEKKLNNDSSCDHKSNHIINLTKESEFCDNFLENYGNRDKIEKSHEFKSDCNSDKWSQQWKASNEGIPIALENNDNYLITICDLQPTVIKLPNSELDYKRSLSITSISSDFVSFDSEPEVVFRRPKDIKDKTSDNLKIRPIPTIRTSIIKSGLKNETKNIFDKSDDSFKSELKHNQTSERMSVQSQDSGISDFSQNSSFLWQKNLSQNCDERQNKISCDEENEIQLVLDEKQNQEIYEHIYEELIDWRSLSPNDWIDIENEDQKEGIKSDMFLSRRSQNFRSNNNYRKSFRPKLHKRKTNKTSSPLIKSSDDSVDSGSATEYEDIDDEDYERSNSVQSQLTEMPAKRVIQQNSDHIYELMSDKEVIELRNPRQTCDTKLLTTIRELSSNKIEKNEQENITQSEELLNKSQFECEPNIYTSTPRRLSLFECNADENGKRDSILSRNSSIYINPNFCRTRYFDDSNDLISNKVEMFKSQSSVTASIASYLELNSSAIEDYSSFESQPLYQFYQKDVRRRAELWIHFDENLTDLEYDDYENNTIYGTYNHSNNLITANKSDDQISCDRIQTLCKRNISTMDLVGYGPNRSLWCQLPQVLNSKDNLLLTLSDKEKRLQESMFEIIASEASYCKSLNILVSHFHNCIEFCENNPQILSLREKKCLFSNIVDISKISSSLLRVLEKRFEKNILLYDICDIIYDYAVNHFQPYIHYCAYQRDQEKLLTKLTQSRAPFVDILQRLESNQICQNQSLLSFLMLPMQRITRYPLLIDAVFQQLHPDSPILDSVRKTLGAVNQLVRKCNEETKKVQRMQELIEIEKILHFRSKIKSYPIVSGARYLVKRGSVLRLSPQLSAKKTIGKSTLKWTKSSIHLFLFSDLLILAKKKSENNYSVFDYCSRSTVQLISLTNSGEEMGVSGSLRILVPRNARNLAHLILLHNHESKSVEYTISCELESEKLRWIEAVSQPSSDNPNEVIYEEWDCPQVQCIKSYSAQQTDEISLEETDVLNVSRKMKDGWFEGQRIRDGVKGWFPSFYTEQIINQHVRARNIRLRHRLLMYTQSVIEEQKKCPKN